MELQYIVLTIIKILISVPAVVLLFAPDVHSAALIGGHANNNANTTKHNASGSNFDFKIDLSDENAQEIADNATDVSSTSEEIPDPSALIVGGYNLPENIFNRGKPFYLEKDPLTGNIDFESRAPSLKLYDDYDYEQESRIVYDKSSIDRKDGPATGSHKPSDINQLTPNFHDFLNLPVKYNPEKYVYPLISSSYANTKVQGNVNNKHNNHKNYVVTTYKPHLNPTYYTTRKQYGGPSNNNNKIIEFTTTTTTTTQAPQTTTTRVPEISSTFKENLMNSPMNHPSFGEEFYLTTSSTTTKRTMSLFEQLFGSDYDDTTTEMPERIPHSSSPSPTLNLFNNLPNKYANDDKYKNEENNKVNPIKVEDEYEYAEYPDKVTTIDLTTTTVAVPTMNTNQKVTSLPLGENHLINNNVNNRQPIIVSSQNLRDRLNNEKVKFGPIRHQAPSTSNIHIAPDQDTVSFVVGNQQNVDGGEYIGTAIKERPYDGGNFRPVYDLPERTGSSATIRPIKTAEASLTIGAPIQSIKIKPGQVVDDNLDYEFDKGSKIVFPDDRSTTHPPDLSPPPPPPPKEVLKLSSKPMFHQLPSDLTPPNEKEPPRLMQRIRPPWDPRPGHFHSGRPEYARPPRPAPDAFKRIDNLPNILPQFRPNMNNHHHHHHPPPHHYPPKNYPRQPLLDRPSNRPIGFFEKLHPPPPPQNIKRTNKEETKKIEDRIGTSSIQEPFAYLQAPPKVVVANRRSGDDPETLQMIQAKKEANKTNISEKPLYVVYPVNSPPLKLDPVENEKKESVVIGTRAEIPLPPSKIPPVLEEFNFELKERNDAPILKPRPISFPIKSDFPYPLERPDPSVFNREPEINRLPDEPTFGSNQWNTIEDTESRIVNNQISATLKTYTDKPIAVAYTPTESHFSMPNYASLVIPEIRPDSSDGSEFTVSAVMHARPQIPQTLAQITQKQDRIDEEAATMPQQDFQAPFQASAHIDHSISQGWSIVRSKEERKDEPTTISAATTSEFDIENFKPQLEGGFKPIYSYPDDKKEGAIINERQE